VFQAAVAKQGLTYVFNWKEINTSIEYSLKKSYISILESLHYGLWKFSGKWMLFVEEKNKYSEERATLFQAVISGGSACLWEGQLWMLASECIKIHDSILDINKPSD
jgi:hypothetical protein